jgi:hypothetical protein
MGQGAYSGAARARDELVVKRHNMSKLTIIFCSGGKKGRAMQRVYNETFILPLKVALFTTDGGKTEDEYRKGMRADQAGASFGLTNRVLDLPSTPGTPACLPSRFSSLPSSSLA